MTTEDGTLEVHESGKGLSVEAGLYPAVVREIEPVDGQFGPQWRFAFTLDEHPEEEPWAWATAKLGTKTKLYRWAGILLGRTLALGEQLTRSDLVGKRCQVLIVERPDADGETRRVVDDIMKEKGTLPRPLESAPAPTPAPQAANAIRTEPADTETCYCGGLVASYSPDGEPLCEEHSDKDEEQPAKEPSSPEDAFPVKEMKSRFDFQREAHQHFKIPSLPAALAKCGYKSTMDVKDWPIAWRLLCKKMTEPAA